ncbi:MAG: SDR family oxidoreductase [Anaerolineae bacterium]|jgi:NAD(P)-dependent dehydrogenase (short-subunit alcohol dehydrogenase family)|nr:SDR family oxidoreductase [Anaerolineae bacterium]
MLLQDHSIVITGAASGIGRATALAAAREGARIAVSDVDSAGLAATVEQAEALGAAVYSDTLDVSNAQHVEAYMGAVVERFGRIDGAFNNAGVGGDIARLHQLGEDLWDRVMDVNLKGVWLCMKYQVLHMRHNGDGASIVNMASAAGLVGFPNNSAYSAAKHGVVGLTKSAAGEYARDNIRINAVCPGYIDTPMVATLEKTRPGLVGATLQGVPMRRLGTVEEVAEAVIFLLSPRSSFMTGHAMSIDGGMVVL